MSEDRRYIRASKMMDVLLVVSTVALIAFFIRTGNLGDTATYALAVVFIAGFRLGFGHALAQVSPRAKRFVR